jgi:hypothetical protein
MADDRGFSTAIQLRVLNPDTDQSDGRMASRIVAKELRQAGFDYDNRKKLVRCSRRIEAQLPLQYCGADDQAGPNYTRQPAVDSYYE